MTLITRGLLLAGLLCCLPVSQPLAKDCLSASEYQRQLIDNTTTQDLHAVEALSQSILSSCPAPLDNRLGRVVDAATIYISLFKLQTDANDAQARLLTQDFSQSGVAEQAFYYQLLASYSLRQGQTKQALSLTHLLTNDMLKNLEPQESASLQLAVATIHFDIEFYQSVRELLSPLLDHPQQAVKMRAAILLWYTPQSQQQLNQSLAIVRQYQQLPDTLLKVSALEVLARDASARNNLQQGEQYLSEAISLAQKLGATSREIDLKLMAAELFASTSPQTSLITVPVTALNSSQQLALTEQEIASATQQQQWQRASILHEQALKLREIIDKNKSLAREYASFELVEQARQLEQAQQQARLQALAAEKQEQQRLIYILALICAVLGLTMVSLLFIKKRRAADHFEKLANTDGLTQVLNRRAIQHFAEQVSANSKLRKQPFVVALADIDHFKSVNDTYGHDAGDVVLTEFAQRTNKLIRQQDRLGRWGGEEWLIIMTNTELKAVNALFTRMQSAIRTVSAAGHELTITFSMGAVAGDGSEPVEALIQAADALLYKAKHNGRNQLVTTVAP
ncbi:GGDEF domain-containing protein [Alteromonas lipolytica]|uniref:GGDEF domain-containing protein n=1 Tax=Alteromonas lipolytica TaxID=1856405 RepID=UPI001586C12A|nr:GGDEF domain-containing protein [Alteromonas lipolytica]